MIPCITHRFHLCTIKRLYMHMEMITLDRHARVVVHAPDLCFPVSCTCTCTEWPLKGHSTLANGTIFVMSKCPELGKSKDMRPNFLNFFSGGGNPEPATGKYPTGGPGFTPELPQLLSCEFNTSKNRDF